MSLYRYTAPWWSCNAAIISDGGWINQFSLFQAGVLQRWMSRSQWKSFLANDRCHDHWPSLKVSGYEGFDWPLGNFPLARSPLYRERLGKLEVFKDNDWRLGEDSSNLSVSNSFSWGIQAKRLYPLRLFACSFLLHLSHWPLIIVLRRVPVEGATWFAKRWGFMPVSKFCWTRNRCGCDFFSEKSWGFLPLTEVSLIAQRSEVCTHCHDRGQTDTQAATPSGSSKLLGTGSPETTTNLSKDDPTLYSMSTSPPALCTLCPSWYVAEKQIADRVWADSSWMVTSVAECQAKWQWFSFERVTWRPKADQCWRLPFRVH